MADKKVAPPIFSNDVSYKFWESRIQILEVVHVTPKNKQGIIVLLQSLTGNKKAEKTVSTLTVTNLHKDTGLQALIAKLDNAFQDEVVENAYSTHKKFVSLKKLPQMSMNEYLLEFENLNHEMTVFNMKIPDTVLAFQMLEGAGLNENQWQMVSTLASDLTFKSMEGALKRVFGSENVEEACNFDNSYLDSQIKQENVCYTQQPSKQKKGKFNPLKKEGVVSRCAICDSKMHREKDCQYKRSETANIAELNNETEDNPENKIEEANIVLMTTDDTKIQTDLNAIIDAACTKTVAGEEWLNNYLKNLDTLISQVEVNLSNRIFKFGDGHKVTAISSVKIPAQIREKISFMIIEIIKEKSPLLLSKSSLKKADTVLNIKNDKIEMFGQNILVESSFNGHYSISILHEIMSSFNDTEQILIFKENETIEETRKKLIKLHKQFGHASSSNLLNLTKNAGVDTKNISKIVGEITKQCNICKLYHFQNQQYQY